MSTRLHTPHATVHSSLVWDPWFAWHSMQRSMMWLRQIAPGQAALDKMQVNDANDGKKLLEVRNKWHFNALNHMSNRHPVAMAAWPVRFARLSDKHVMITMSHQGTVVHNNIPGPQCYCTPLLDFLPGSIQIIQIIKVRSRGYLLQVCLPETVGANTKTVRPLKAKLRLVQGSNRFSPPGPGSSEDAAMAVSAGWGSFGSQLRLKTSQSG